MSAPAEVILNVDDTEAIRYAKTRTLEHAGFKVLEAGTGADALRLVEEARPALVLLDVKLPDMSGITVCQVIKRDFPTTLVLQTSASFVATSDRVRGLDSGADSYLTEPVELEELVAAVRALLRLRRAERAARESEERYRLIVESAVGYAIFTADLEGRVTSWSSGARSILGYQESQIVGRPLAVVFTPEDVAAGAPEREMRKALAEGHADDERWHLRRDGSRFWATGRLMPLRDAGADTVGFLKILGDRTAQKLAEDQLKVLNERLEQRVAERTGELAEANRRLREEMEERQRVEAHLHQAQKLDALGQMTGGIAHDFNNLLTVSIMNLDYIGQDKSIAEKYARRIELMTSAAHQGAKLVRQLLAFARKQPLEPQVIDLSELMPGLVELVRRAVGATIEVESIRGGGLWRTLLDPAQFESAALNLALNARDAMPDGGKLTIELANASLDDEYAAQNAEVTPGQYVLVAVSDTGAGMTPEVAARAFEPFFTTKPLGKGTGLGLSMVYGFVKQTGGHLKIYSEAGHGTTVRLYFPRSREGMTEAPAAPSAPAAPGHETILVVEDEAGLRTTVVGTLRDMGYDVLEAADGPRALDMLSGSGRRIDLLFTDMILPGALTGRTLAAAALALKPDLKILFTSGYTADSLIHHGRLEPGINLLSKPYRKEQLAQKLRQVLGTRAAGR